MRANDYDRGSGIAVLRWEIKLCVYCAAGRGLIESKRLFKAAKDRYAAPVDLVLTLGVMKVVERVIHASQ